MPSNHLILCCSLLLSCFQSFPESGSFPINNFFSSGGQSTGVSASKSVPPMNTQDWSPSEWTGWISLESKGLSRVFSNTTVQKHQFFSAHLSSLEKAMATHSSILAWKIPWTKEPGRLQSMESLRVRHDWATSLSLLFHALEKEMATQSSVLAWRIPRMGEPGGLPSMGSHRVGHDWSDLAAASITKLWLLLLDEHSSNSNVYIKT